MARTPSLEARSALLDAAQALVTERGVRDLSVEDVVRRSGVAKTTLYRHFGGLDGLVFALVGSRVEAAEAPDTGSLRDDLRAIQRAYLDRFEDPLQRELFVWMVGRAMQDPVAAAQFRVARFDHAGPTAVAIQRAISRDEVPPTLDVPLAMHLIQGALISKRVISDEPLTDEHVEALLDLVVAALRGG